MARRPDYTMRESSRREDVLSKQDLNELADQLSHLSPQAVHDFYERAHRECRITSRDFPSPRAVQQLVAAWKLLRKWRK